MQQGSTTNYTYETFTEAKKRLAKTDQFTTATSNISYLSSLERTRFLARRVKKYLEKIKGLKQTGLLDRTLSSESVNSGRNIVMLTRIAEPK